MAQLLAALKTNLSAQSKNRVSPGQNGDIEGTLGGHRGDIHDCSDWLGADREGTLCPVIGQPLQVREDHAFSANLPCAGQPLA